MNPIRGAKATFTIRDECGQIHPDALVWAGYVNGLKIIHGAPVRVPVSPSNSFYTTAGGGVISEKELNRVQAQSFRSKGADKAYGELLLWEGTRRVHIKHAPGRRPVPLRGNRDPEDGEEGTLVASVLLKPGMAGFNDGDEPL